MPELVRTEPGRPATPPVAVSSITTEANHTGSWKYIRPAYHDRVAPCNAACPLGVDVEGYMALLREGRIDEAAELLAREHPMPAVTGRVCNHPCEDGCNRRHFDDAVAIHAVERMLGDRLLAAPLPQALPVTHAEAVAVVGSGPAGLSAAYHLARLGYRVEVFEQAEKAGGMLRHGIPPYRLPRAVLDGQVERIRALGVEIHTGVSLGRDVRWSELAERFGAVFFATGAYVGKPLGVPGDDAAGVWQGLGFLERCNRGEAPEVGRRVVVIGGGNTAMDCARTARRLGAEVTVAYRRTRAEMPAIAAEIDDAEREGVLFRFLAAPERVDEADGRVRGIECTPMRLGEPDASGRRRPEPSGEPPFCLPADTVLLAIGEDAQLGMLPAEAAERGALAVDAWGATRLSGIFAGGDAAGHDRTVAHALGAGKRAALGIDRYLRRQRGDEPPTDDLTALRYGGSGNLSSTRWRDDDPVRRVAPLNEVVGFESLNLNHFQHAARHPDRRTGNGAAYGDFGEVNRGLESDVALTEAGRCFNCGVCNGCELCLIFCGDAAIHPSADGGGRFEIDLEYCKGCGVCAAECPRGAISMTREAL